MRSITFTLLLALLAATVCGVIGWRIREGNLDAIFGTPPTQPGQLLYQGFQPSDVARISISSQGIRGRFENTPHGWQSSIAPHDRMHPPYAVGIINFTLGLRILDSAPADEIDRDAAGLRDDSVQILLESENGTELARYRIGRKTPLQTENQQDGGLHSSTFIQPRERDRRGYVYACTGDISPIFRDGLKELRDHRPFFINPIYLQKIRIRGEQGELTLNHAEPGDKAPWRIEKPLDIPTDRTAMLSLLNGLVELRAEKLSDRSAVTLPSAETATRSLQIGVTTFGSPDEVLLEVFLPETPDATEVLATVSDRPDTVFHLKRSPETNRVINLPITVNELRNRSLLNLNLESLRSITLNPRTGTPIRISGQPKQSWQVEINGQSQEANENRLLSLLDTITSARAVTFESDAATDFSQWGLDTPILIIDVTGETGQTVRIRFGIDNRGRLFANRDGTSTVMSIDEKLLSAISISPYEWRPALLWSVSPTDLISMTRQVRDETPLELDYDDFEEKWTGKISGEDVSDRIDPMRAKYLLDTISGLKVSRWLSTSDEVANAALESPVFTLTVRERTVDDFGDAVGEKRRTLTLAPVPNETSYYGRMSEEAHPFLIDRETVLKIATDPLEK